MATLTKIVRRPNCLNTLCKLFNSITISENSTINRLTQSNNSSLILSKCTRNIYTAPKLCDLMEFFDDKKNWGENEVKTGRAWRKEELRIKSNTDLHKLWYILLKERNMLLTMEEECKAQIRLFPSPERLDKVEESMKNLEHIVRERNRAYHLLETGETGERPTELVQNELGYHFKYKQTEHLIPKELNSAWKKTHNFQPRGHAVSKFQLYYREKIYNEKRKKRNRDRNHVMGLLKRFPNLDLEAVKAQYPDVDIEKCRENKKARGHFIPK